MANKVVTIKDIAAELGVSPTTVHKAMYNKKGISEDTRKEILAYIESNHFRLNKAASALKRKTIRLAALLIEPVGSRRYFYADIQSGVDRAFAELSQFNVELEKYFSPLESAAQHQALERIWREQGQALDGLLLVPAHESELNQSIKKFTDAGVRVVTVNSDIRHGTRHACVASNTLMSGRLAGEMLCDMGVSPGKQVILIAGNRDMYNHWRTSRGFLNYMQEEAPGVDILEIYDSPDTDSVERKLRKFLESFDDIGGIYCNTSRNTLDMCRIIHDMGLSGRLPVIGSDVFSELMPYYESRTLTASIYQNPMLQGSTGLRFLYNLLTGESQVPEQFEISTGIALRSNAESFLGTGATGE